ncbi:MAG: DUF971 domain-containing protein [Phycisphaerales bacterium]|nr:DUF971 domain-containing protein [Phycisphaerales bacterium]
MEPPPRHLDLQRAKGLNVTWHDGSTSFLPVDHLRRMSPSAEARALRTEIEQNPLTVLPSGDGQALRAEDLELVGSYAVRITFSDGHHTGLYTWAYLRSLDTSQGDKTTP